MSSIFSSKKNKNALFQTDQACQISFHLTYPSFAHSGIIIQKQEERVCIIWMQNIVVDLDIGPIRVMAISEVGGDNKIKEGSDLDCMSSSHQERQEKVKVWGLK